MKTEHEKYVEIIRPLLKPKRFEHSLNVAQQAVLLAAGAVAMDAKVCYNLGR